MNWKKIFKKEKKILFDILYKVSKERLKKIIYPIKEDVFNAFLYTPFNNIKVVIIGQDPYCNPGQAHGLAFSVTEKCIIPPSLKNIYQELTNDLSLPKGYYKHGCLNSWANQGVLLLNSILTVEKGRPASHNNFGWEIFTNNIISYINLYLKNIIFLLWGKFAQKKNNMINSNKHFILQTSHPSPLSVNLGFFGCRHFSKVNNILLKNDQKIIHW